MPEASKLAGIPPKLSKNPPNKHSNGPSYHTQKDLRRNSHLNPEVQNELYRYSATRILSQQPE